MAPAPRLFGDEAPPGFSYRADFITESEEAALLERIATITFSSFEMRGVVAKRRVAFFGQSYDRGEAQPLPAFLFPLRETIATWAGLEPDAFAMALINEYPPGAPIGWAPRCAAVRYRRRRFSALRMPNAIPALSFACVCKPIG